MSQDTQSSKFHLGFALAVLFVSGCSGGGDYQIIPRPPQFCAEQGGVVFTISGPQGAYVECKDGTKFYKEWSP